MKAPIVEIFSSFQGEGLWIGRRQIFVRFAGCNLDCNYCDTSVSKSTNSGVLMSVDEVFEKIEELKTPDLHSISFTGGEPLLYADFINELSNKLHNKLLDNLSNFEDMFNIKIMIETNGTLPDSLSKIKKIDCVSLDIKLKEHIGQKWEDNIFENELATLKLMIERKIYTYCKLVVSPFTDLSTIKNIGKELTNIIESNNYGNEKNIEIPIILQPASPIEQWKHETDLLFKFSETMGKYMEVLTIPQTHKFLNIE